MKAIFEGISCSSDVKPEWVVETDEIAVYPLPLSSYVSEIASALIAHYDDTPFWISAGVAK